MNKHAKIQDRIFKLLAAHFDGDVIQILGCLDIVKDAVLAYASTDAKAKFYKRLNSVP